jgi:glycosyltransferase involved in cell wall biosynthesis
MSLRIHLVSEHASPLALLGTVDAGGQNVHVAALAKGLQALGAKVVVHTRRDDPSLPRRVTLATGVIVEHVDAGPPVPLPKDELLPHMGQFADELERSWNRVTPDVVHAHFWMSGLAAMDAGARVGVPVAQTFHALGAEKQAHQGAADRSPAPRLEAERWLAANVDHLIPTTAREFRTLVDMGGRPDRMTVVPCGVDLELFRPDGPTWPRSSGRPRIVCVSRLVPRKGIGNVIAAVAKVPDVELLIAGGPPASMLFEDEYARTLLSTIDHLALGDRVQLLGAVERPWVPSLMRSADIVCCTPWYEPFGMVALEAMACGAPVVASCVGGLAETVLDGHTGILVPPRQPRSIRAAIEVLLHDPARRRAMGTSALRRAASYAWPTIAARTLHVAERMQVSGRKSVATPPPSFASSRALTGGAQ